MSDEQKAMMQAALDLIEKTNAAAKASAQPATGHMAEIDATVGQMEAFNPVCTDEQLAALKADLSLGKILPETAEGVIGIVRMLLAKFLV